MTHIITSIDQLKRRINDRIYMDTLTIDTVCYNINECLYHLTDLTKLHLRMTKNNPQRCDPPDLSKLTNLKHLHLDNDYTESIDLSSLTNLTYLNFTWYNYEIDLSKLSKLECLIFADIFDQPTDLSNLSNLTFLKFGYEFNQPVEYLSCLNNLEYLEFGVEFYHPIDISKLEKLTELKIKSPIEDQHFVDLSSCKSLKKFNGFIIKK